MYHVSKSHIFLQQFAATKYQALQQACYKLVEAGMVQPPYFHGMCKRELLSSTYLDHGIAVPHGVPTSRSEIRNNGLVMMQFPKGVDWGDNNRVFLLFAMAARGGEHLEMLSHLTRSLDNTYLCRELAVTDKVDEVFEAITGCYFY